MKEWFGLMFSRNAMAGGLIILLGFIIYLMRGDAATLKQIADNIQGVIIGYFMGKFATDQPGNGKPGEGPPK